MVRGTEPSACFRMLSQLVGLLSRMILVRADLGRKGKLHVSIGLAPADTVALGAVTLARFNVVDLDIREVTGPGLDFSRKALTPRSTEPPMAERDLRSLFCWSRGWLEILSTSSRSSVEDTRLLTKAVSKTGCL